MDAIKKVVLVERLDQVTNNPVSQRALSHNRHLNIVRRRLGYPYWSLSAHLKHRVKNAVQYMASFAEAVADEAIRRDVDGVVCGHIHHAEIREIGGVLYCNDGDWVESCTALVEHFDGTLELINWIERWALDPLTGREVVPVDADIELPEPVHADFQG